MNGDLSTFLFFYVREYFKKMCKLIYVVFTRTKLLQHLGLDFLKSSVTHFSYDAYKYALLETASNVSD